MPKFSQVSTYKASSNSTPNYKKSLKRAKIHAHIRQVKIKLFWRWNKNIQFGSTDVTLEKWQNNEWVSEWVNNEWRGLQTRSSIMRVCGGGCRLSTANWLNLSWMWWATAMFASNMNSSINLHTITDTTTYQCAISTQLSTTVPYTTLQANRCINIIQHLWLGNYLTAKKRSQLMAESCFQPEGNKA